MCKRQSLEYNIFCIVFETELSIGKYLVEIQEKVFGGVDWRAKAMECARSNRWATIYSIL